MQLGDMGGTEIEGEGFGEGLVCAWEGGRLGHMHSRFLVRCLWLENPGRGVCVRRDQMFTSVNVRWENQ